MNIKNVFSLALCLICTAILFSSCSSNKIAFGNSYYFKQTPKVMAEDLPTSSPRIEPLPESRDLLVASESLPVQSREVKGLMDNARTQLAEAVAKSDNDRLKASAEKVNNITTSIESENLTKKEIKDSRKELRKEIKSLKKEYKNMAPEETQEMDKLLLLTIILAAGGLLFLILSAIVPALGIIGLLALIGSLVTLIIWATKQ